jgi:hypothetical protein
MYLASATRPDISFDMNKLSRFISNLGDDHWRALERVLRYLKGTMSYVIHYTGYPRVLEGYSDSNWISNTDELKATSGYVFSLGSGAFLELLQVDHHYEVNNESRISSIRYRHG